MTDEGEFGKYNGENYDTMTFSKIKQRRRSKIISIIHLDQCAVEYDRQFETRKQLSILKFITKEEPVTQIKNVKDIELSKSESQLVSNIDAYRALSPKISSNPQNQSLKEHFNTMSMLKHMSSTQRLENRESSTFRLNEISDRKTNWDIKKARKQEMDEKYKMYYKKK